jgi:hypothetical protein
MAVRSQRQHSHRAQRLARGERRHEHARRGAPRLQASAQPRHRPGASAAHWPGDARPGSM